MSPSTVAISDVLRATTSLGGQASEEDCLVLRWYQVMSFLVNVPMLSSSFYTLIHDPSCQIAYYHPGIGTEPLGALTGIGRRVTRLT